jgi:hypothetical protein
MIGLPEEDQDDLGFRPRSEENARFPRIAAPEAANSMHAVTLRGLGPVPAGNPSGTADLESRGLASHIAAAPIAKPSALDTRKAGDEAELERLQKTGSGISQIKNPFARGALRGLETVGNILLPSATPMIPGTEAHHNLLTRQATGRIGEDELEAEREATTGKTAAETDEAQARARSLDAATAAAGKPKAKEEKWSPFTGYTDADGTPLIHEENSGQVVRASDKQPPTGFKLAAPKSDKPDNPEQQLIDAEAAVASAKTPEEKAAAQAKLAQLKKTISEYSGLTAKPEKSGAASARSDKSYTYNNDKLDKLGKPIEDAVARMGRLRETLAQGSPQADALVAPELLTIMAGGAGSGLRMNEAEISRIVGGRSKWQSLEASINQWRLDPTKANSITPDQRQEIRSLVEAVNSKLMKKQQALDEAREGLLNSDDPTDHRRIVTNAHHALTQVDEAAGTEGGGAGGTIVSLAKARQLPQNQGKTDAEIRKDIESHGHRVTD